MTAFKDISVTYSAKVGRPGGAVFSSAPSYPQLIKFQGRVTFIHVSTEYRSGRTMGAGRKIGDLEVQVGSAKIPVTFDMRTDYVGIRRGMNVQVSGEVANGWNENSYPRSVAAHEMVCLDTGETFTNKGLGLEALILIPFAVFAVFFDFTIATQMLSGPFPPPAIEAAVFFVWPWFMVAIAVAGVIHSARGKKKLSEFEYVDLSSTNGGAQRVARAGRNVSDYVESELAKASQAWGQVTAIQGEGWRGDLVRAMLRLHSAVESGIKARYALSHGVEAPVDIKFLDVIQEEFPNANMGDMRWFNALRNKVAHGTYDPSMQECGEAFRICKPIMDQILNYSPP